jgi:hypothetical protein
VKNYNEKFQNKISNDNSTHLNHKGSSHPNTKVKYKKKTSTVDLSTSRFGSYFSVPRWANKWTPGSRTAGG